ncbi:MAG: carboxypeptidase regulatory-like domain-containing protein [Bryobacterales bacterium]|nr:carboxypeptidase regulatory-like domain-containing protein [Bryobacterales bacterium]
MAAKGVGKFRLDVPLDASGVKDFKPERGVKVVAFDGKGQAYESIAKFDAKGRGTASITFQEAPGNLQVVVGPEDATADQLMGLQTISVNVSRRQWAGQSQLTLAAVPISAYYWWWWFRWCRTFRITGRVVCADGNPVPGATVCAYDVDWWWWWWSNQQVGCAVTDQNGAFEINFTWCCGWWPWWWWARRHWLLEPVLADRLTRLLREAKFPRIPLPDPNPDPAIFETLLNASTAGPPVRPPAGAGRNTAVIPRAVAAEQAFDSARLESLRTRLAGVLPGALQFERLRLWPWWPWWPWWDCAPDIIFKVTQPCRGTIETIVNETIWDARSNIPVNLDVTLAANDKACCVTGSTCLDGGDCAFISNICEDNIGNIGGNPGPNVAAPQVGYLSPGLNSISGDRPYSGTVPLRGCMGDTVDYYEVLYSTVGFGGPWTPIPGAAAGGFSRSYWDNGLSDWVPVPFPFTTISDGVSDHTVIESLPHWEANHAPQLWDAYTVNLLFEFVTQNVLADGTYYLRLRGWTRPGYAGNISTPVDLPICGSQTLNGVAVTIDNHLVTAGPSDLNGHLCLGTVHQCTTEPDTTILAVQILHNNGTSTNVSACGQVAVADTDLLQIDFVANDPDPHPHLAYYTLQLHFDVNLFTDLLDPSLSNWSLVPSPIAPAWAPAAAQVGPNYGDANPAMSALDQGASSPYWRGGAMRLTVKAKDTPMSRGAFPYTCCYQIRLNAHKRTIGGGGAGCDHSFWSQWNVTEYSFTIDV